MFWSAVTSVRARVAPRTSSVPRTSEWRPRHSWHLSPYRTHRRLVRCRSSRCPKGHVGNRNSPRDPMNSPERIFRKLFRTSAASARGSSSPRSTTKPGRNWSSTSDDRRESARRRSSPPRVASSRRMLRGQSDPLPSSRSGGTLRRSGSYTPKSWPACRSSGAGHSTAIGGCGPASASTCHLPNSLPLADGEIRRPSPGSIRRRAPRVSRVSRTCRNSA
jgi:hypothetical protein